ncbi:MAG: HEPN domain-containing protein [Chloroflexi bacterium]|nr:HEPN domain-containing protein [Chloroflexota bacterium]
MKRATRAWLELAAKDLTAAQALAADEYVANIVVFHCQQCVEKALKAVLEESDLDVPRIHGIHRLNAMVQSEASCFLPLSEEEMDMLDDAYIDVRYPGVGLLPSGFPSKHEAEQFLQVAERTYQAVKAFLLSGKNAQAQ